MFDRFGEFDSAQEINELAVNLRKEGDTDSIRVLAKENGIDEDMAELFISGDVLYLCNEMTAAIGKIDVEAAALRPKEIMADWVDYIKARCFEDEEMAKAVRKKGKTLEGAIAKMIGWSFNHQIPIDTKILKAANISASRVTLGIPGMGTAKNLLKEYYIGR